MNKQIRVGILSDCPFVVTGYANQAVRIANILADEGMNVYYFGCNYLGQPLKPGIKFEDNMELKFTVIGQGREGYFKDLLSQYCKQFKLDVLLILLDTFMLFPWLMELDLSPAKVIFLFPSDGGSGMPLGCEQILRFVHQPVAMAKFGQEQVKKMYGIDTLYIPHAVDIQNYYPLNEKEKLELRRKWNLEGKFVVGCVARNQGRKMMDKVIKSFALFAPKCPEAMLLLHTDPADNAQVFPIGYLIQRYGIQNRVLFTGMRFFNGFTYKQMNEVYNLMDVFLLTTSGEGFGIPLIEAQACSVPVLCTNYTTTYELVIEPKSGLGINLVEVEEIENPTVHCNENLDGTITGSWAVERAIPSSKDACKKLEYIKNNPEIRKLMGENGRKNAVENYSWDKIGKKWVDLITKLGESY